MPPAASATLRDVWTRQQGLIFPLLIVASVLVIVVPLPALVMDLLLSANITLAVVILLTTIQVRKPLEFSVFPSLLLGTTLLRLVLNVASTRLILTRGGTDGTEAAGRVIQTFGEFVAGGQVAVGLILFLILVAIQFLVITQGATRISEVAARFVLDALPGRQMSIDADVQAGAITAAEARQRRNELTAQADFHGAMDGASKFVRGDAMAGLVITAINIVGGMYMGLVEYGLSVREAAEVFTKLTIGDGLVTQVPAFLISLAAGLLVTRGSTESDLSRDVIRQTFEHPRALGVAAVFLIGLSFTGLPQLPLLALAGCLAALAVWLPREPRRDAATVSTTISPTTPPKSATDPADRLHVEPLEIELGFGLIRLADPAANGRLLDHVNRLRTKVAEELGIIVPKVRIRDNLRLKQRQYQIKLHDVPVTWGEVYPDGWLAVETTATTGDIAGIEAREPWSDRRSVWIESSQRDRADQLGYRVLDAATVIAGHLGEIVRRHSDEILSRQQVHQLLDNLKLRSPRVVDELVPSPLKPSLIHQVLSHLLREAVPIRNLATILETLGDHVERDADPLSLTEHVRQSLARTICQQHRDAQRVMRVVTLDPVLEETLATTIELPPRDIEHIVQAVTNEIRKAATGGTHPVLLCRPDVRLAVKQITSTALPHLAVLSFREITADTVVESLGQVSVDVPPSPARRDVSARKHRTERTTAGVS
ncbi:MAG: flagellar biosynthesis protein FlhA [Planctomycetales bacterium]|nr:flagellar biosynthesis protein FlhA [Planctomycetales bacterium]